MRVLRYLTASVVLFSVLLGSMVVETAGLQPGERIQHLADAVFLTINDKDFGKEEKRKRIREIIAPHFDFYEMAKRTLGFNWKKYEKRLPEFIPLFTELLENTYLRWSNIEAVKGATMRLLGEQMDTPYATVHTKVTTSRGIEHSITYRMHIAGGEWKIYDILVEGISMVNNYRAQFSKILSSSSSGDSFEELLERIRKNLAEAKSRR